MASLLENISGETGRTKLTLDGFFENVPWAAASCVVNAAGGAMAGRVDAAFASFLPKMPGAGPFGVFIFATALKAIFPQREDVSNVIRELAGGMAGWVGDDLYYAVRNFFRPVFAIGRSYKSGDVVRHNGGVWVAQKDIPYPPQAIPGLDSRWQQMQRAQGYRAEDLKQYAQAFMADRARVDAIVDDVAAEMARRGQDVDQAAFAAEMKGVLYDVIGQFAA